MFAQGPLPKAGVATDCRAIPSPRDVQDRPADYDPVTVKSRCVIHGSWIYDSRNGFR